jgi:hypothetical protein
MHPAQMDFFSETIERKIMNLEKRMVWIRRDIEFLKGVYEMTQKKPFLPKKPKIEQLKFLDT